MGLIHREGPSYGIRRSETKSRIILASVCAAEVDTTVALPPNPTFTQTVEYEEADAWSGLIGTTILFMDGKLQADIIVELFNNEGVFVTIAYNF